MSEVQEISPALAEVPFAQDPPPGAAPTEGTPPVVEATTAPIEFDEDGYPLDPPEPTPEEAAVKEAAVKVEGDRLARAKATAQRAREQADKQRKREVQARRERETYERTLSGEKALADQFRRAVALAKSGDPVEVLGLLGVDPQATVDAMVNRVDPKNEKERETQELRRQIENERQARMALEKTIKDERAAKANQEEIDRNISNLRGLLAEGTRYPHSAKLPERILFSQVEWMLGDAEKRSGIVYSFDEALEVIEDQLATRSAANTPKPKTEAQASQEKSASPSRTITNELSSKSYSAPKALDQMSDKEQKEFFLRQFHENAKK